MAWHQSSMAGLGVYLRLGRAVNFYSSRIIFILNVVGNKLESSEIFSPRAGVRFGLGLVDLTSDGFWRLSARYFLGSSAKSGPPPKHPQRQSSHERNPHSSAAGDQVLSRSIAQMIFLRNSARLDGLGTRRVDEAQRGVFSWQSQPSQTIIRQTRYSPEPSRGRGTSELPSRSTPEMIFIKESSLTLWVGIDLRARRVDEAQRRVFSWQSQLSHRQYSYKHDTHPNQAGD